MSDTRKIPEWQRKVAYATNAAGAVAGPAAIAMAIKQARERKGGMPRQAVEAAERKIPKSRVLSRAGRVMRHPASIAVGGATAVGLQAANWTGDSIAAYALKKPKSKTPSSEKASKAMETITDFSKAQVRGTGHGQSLVAKRNFDAEADRQRRMGMYAGLGLGGGIALGDQARRRIVVTRTNESGLPVTRKEVKAGKVKARAAALKSGTKAEMPKITRGLQHVGSGRTAAALAGGAALSTAGGIAAYKRGLSERNKPWN